MVINIDLIVQIIPIVLDILVLLFFIEKVTKIRLNKMYLVYCTSIYAVLYALKVYSISSNSSILQVINPILSIIFLLLAIKLTSKITLSRAIVVLLEYIVVTGLVSVFVLMIMTFITSKFDSENYNRYSALVMNVLNNILIVSCIRKGDFGIYGKGSVLIERVKKSPLAQLQVLILSASVVTIILTFTGSVMKGEVNKLAVLIFGFILLLVIGISIFLVNKVIEEAVRQSNIEMQEVYIDNSKQVLKDIKEFWHNYSNIIYGLQCIYENNLSKEEIMDVIKDLLDWDKKKAIKGKVEVLHIDNPVIKGIIAEKLSKAREKGLNVEVTARDVGKIDINIIEIIEMLGILLDNAIEYSSVSYSKIMDLKVEKGNDSSFIFTVVSSYIEKEGQPYKEEKSNKIGLEYINKLSKRNSNKVSLICSKEERVTKQGDNLYKAILVIR